MPLYEYACGDGHITERLMPVEAEKTECFTCGKTATRQAVYHIAFNQRFQPADYAPPSGFREAHAEAMGYKQEARAALAEARANGYEG